ncbi:hypothetical protein VDGL01_04244 [Verticillium dahliae]
MGKRDFVNENRENATIPWLANPKPGSSASLASTPHPLTPRLAHLPMTSTGVNELGLAVATCLDWDSKKCHPSLSRSWSMAVYTPPNTTVAMQFFGSSPRTAQDTLEAKPTPKVWREGGGGCDYGSNPEDRSSAHPCRMFPIQIHRFGLVREALSSKSH